MLSVAVLASGNGSNLQALLDAAARPASGMRVCAVFSDRADAGALRRARSAGVAAEHVDPAAWPTRRDHDLALCQRIEASGATLVALAGYMRVLHPDAVRRFAGRMLNIHPSLLPRHPGLHTHRSALAAGDAEHGATVHVVTAELDAGPRLLQFRLAVRPWDDADSLAARVLTGEHLIYPLAVRWFAQSRLSVSDGVPHLDGQPLRHPAVLTADGLDGDDGALAGS